MPPTIVARRVLSQSHNRYSLLFTLGSTCIYRIKKVKTRPTREDILINIILQLLGWILTQFSQWLYPNNKYRLRHVP